MPSAAAAVYWLQPLTFRRLFAMLPVTMLKKLHDDGRSCNSKNAESALFSERLRQVRGAVKQKDFARMLGFQCVSTYCRYENGHIPKAEVLKKIAEACKISVDWLIGKDADAATFPVHEGRPDYGTPRNSDEACDKDYPSKLESVPGRPPGMTFNIPHCVHELSALFCKTEREIMEFLMTPRRKRGNEDEGKT